MRIGLFFGSFNPIHIGHLIMAKHLVQFSDLDKVWFVVSPQNPLKSKSELLNEYDRLEMVRLAIEHDHDLSASDVEFKLSQPSYTIHTLLVLHERYPEYTFCPIMGMDSYNTLHKWKSAEQIAENYPLYVYPRPGVAEAASPLQPKDVNIISNVPLMDISASYIRLCLKEKKSIEYLVPAKVAAFIDKWGFYQSAL